MPPPMIRRTRFPASTCELPPRPSRRKVMGATTRTQGLVSAGAFESACAIRRRFATQLGLGWIGFGADQVIFLRLARHGLIGISVWCHGNPMSVVRPT